MKLEKILKRKIFKYLNVYNKLTNRNNFLQKFRDLDFILLACILILGFISLATMYSTDGGEILSYTKSHLPNLLFLRL